jgi:hypothetical protein
LRLAPRDRYIGWSDATRQSNLRRVINNNRFLTCPGYAFLIWSAIFRRAPHS